VVIEDDGIMREYLRKMCAWVRDWQMLFNCYAHGKRQKEVQIMT